MVDEQGKYIHYMYVIKDSTQKIIGRINLVDIVKDPFNKAELGYRIGEEYIGNGYAKKAVELVLEEASEKYKIHRIEAGVSSENIASQKVLESSRFRYVGTCEKYIYLNNKWHDSMIFEKILN
ncbi:MAG: GNAT family N-acetyltransferase [Sarcina sp.]